MQDRSLRITLLIHALTGGGAERQICSLANYLTNKGFRCTLITLDSQENDRYSIDSRVARVSLDKMRSSRSILDAIFANRKRILAVREAVRRSQPDCVISFCDKMNIVAIAACRPFSIPLIVSERSDPRRQKIGWLWEAARRWHYPKCDVCVCQTVGVGEYLRKIIGKKPRIEIIPSAIEPPSQASIKKIPDTDHPMTLLYVGRLSHEKGPDRLINAWTKLAAKHPSWKLAFVGNGPLESTLKQRCHDQGIQKSVEFLGWQEDVWLQLYKAHAFVLPSRYEGFPGVLIEAMYARLPVVATDCSDSIREMIDHEQTGLIAANTDETLSNELDRVMTNAMLREQLGIAAHLKATQFVWSQIGDRWIKLIEEIALPTPAS